MLDSTTLFDGAVASSLFDPAWAAGVSTVAPTTTIAVTVMNLAAKDRIGTTDHPLVAAKALFRR